MDISRLHYFCTVVQTGSLTKASELLHISQPALSKAIKLLESEIGKPLTIPSGRGIAVTDFGLRLAEESKPLLAGIFSLKEKIISAKSVNAVVRIGSFEVFTTYFLSQILSGSLRDTSLDVTELIPGLIEKALLQRTIDIGITYLPIPNPELDFMKVAKIEMKVYRKKTGGPQLPFEEWPFVVPNFLVEGTPSKAKGLDGWPDDRYPRKIVHRVSMMEGALELCRKGFAYGYFPKFIVEAHNAQAKSSYFLEEVSLPSQIKVNPYQAVYIVKRRADVESTEFKRIAAELRQLN